LEADQPAAPSFLAPSTQRAARFILRMRSMRQAGGTIRVTGIRSAGRPLERMRYGPFGNAAVGKPSPPFAAGSFQSLALA